MGKGGTVLGFIGILIGAAGLGFGFIAWNSLSRVDGNFDGMQNSLDLLERISNGTQIRLDELNATQGISDAWYDVDFNVFTVTPAFTLLELSNLVVLFESTSNASVVLSFTCLAKISLIAGFSQVFFYFKVDGVRLDHPTTNVGYYQGGSTTEYFSVNLQHFIENMAAGNHNVTMEVSTQNPVNEISEMTLLVQSFTS